MLLPLAYNDGRHLVMLRTRYDSVMHATIRQFGLPVLAAVLLSGCGGSSPTATSPAGAQTVTFHVKDMGKRLELM